MLMLVLVILLALAIPLRYYLSERSCYRYVDEKIYELEKVSVFAKNWVGICGAHKLKQPGDYVTGTLSMCAFYVRSLHMLLLVF